MRFLKLAVDNVSKILCNLFNSCVEKGEFPIAFKKARVVPVHKKGKYDMITNYRPISVLSNISKIFEACIYSRLNHFFTSHNLLSSNQYGYRKERSTELAVFSLIDKVLPAFERKSFCISVFLDYTACFDTVSRLILLRKLYKYGIRGSIHDFIKSYFSKRQQYVNFSNSSSCVLEQDLGVIQGSKCGPLFFDIYSSDLSKLCSDSEFIMYADDTCLVYCGDDLHELVAHVNKKLQVVLDWCRYNKMSLNAQKCKFMLISSKHVDINPIIRIGNEEVEKVDNYKYLGLMIDDKLRYDGHIEVLSGKLSQLCGVSYRLKNHFDTNTAKNFYYSLVYSSLTYCICIWGGVIQCTQRCSRILSLHRRIVNNLFLGFCRNDECVFKKFKILKLRDVHIFNVSIYMFRIIKLNECPTLQSGIDLIYPDHEYDTRNRDLLIGEFPRVETLRYNYKYQLKKIWNDISQPIKDLTKLSIFKRTLKEHLLSKY